MSRFIKDIATRADFTGNIGNVFNGSLVRLSFNGVTITEVETSVDPQIFFGSSEFAQLFVFPEDFIYKQDQELTLEIVHNENEVYSFPVILNIDHPLVATLENQNQSTAFTETNLELPFGASFIIVTDRDLLSNVTLEKKIGAGEWIPHTNFVDLDGIITVNITDYAQNIQYRLRDNQFTSDTASSRVVNVNSEAPLNISFTDGTEYPQEYINTLTFTEINLEVGTTIFIQSDRTDFTGVELHINDVSVPYTQIGDTNAIALDGEHFPYKETFNIKFVDTLVNADSRTITGIVQHPIDLSFTDGSEYPTEYINTLTFTELNLEVGTDIFIKTDIVDFTNIELHINNVSVPYTQVDSTNKLKINGEYFPYGEIFNIELVDLKSDANSRTITGYVEYPIDVEIETETIQEGELATTTLTLVEPTYDPAIEEYQITLNGDGQSFTHVYDPSLPEYSWDNVLTELALISLFDNFNVEYLGSNELQITAKAPGEEFNNIAFNVEVEELITSLSFYDDAVFRLSAWELQKQGKQDQDVLTAQDLTDLSVNQIVPAITDSPKYIQNSFESGFPAISMIDGFADWLNINQAQPYTLIFLGYIYSNGMRIFNPSNFDSPNRTLMGHGEFGNPGNLYYWIDGLVVYDGEETFENSFLSFKFFANGNSSKMTTNKQDRNITSSVSSVEKIDGILTGVNQDRPHITELLVIPRELTPTEKQEYLDYIANRYGIA